MMANTLDHFYKANLSEKKNAFRISIFDAGMYVDNLVFLCEKRDEETLSLSYKSSSESGDDDMEDEGMNSGVEDDSDGEDANTVTIANETDIQCLNAVERFSDCKLPFHEALTYETLFFENKQKQVIGLNRSILFSKHNKPQNCADLVKNVNYVMKRCPKIAVFMYSGDVFVGAIFDGNNYLVHRTLRRYITRRKQGGRQGKYDNRNATGAKSAGAQIRNEEHTKMQNDIYHLIHKDWGQYVDECGLILLWASRNRRYMFGCPNSYKDLKFNWKTDPRIRYLIGGVAKLNKEALKQMFIRAISVEVFDEMALKMLIQDLKDAQIKEEELTGNNNNTKLNDCMKKLEKCQEKEDPTQNEPKYRRRKSTNSEMNTNEQLELSKLENNFSEQVIVEKRKRRGSERKKEESKVLSPEEIEEDNLKQKLFNLVLNEAVEDLISLLDTIKPHDRLARIICCFVQRNTQTLLHLAIKNDLLSVIPILLKYGCCPTIRNSCNLTPFDFATKKAKHQACKIMKNYMFNNPHKYDYVEAEFPGGEDPIKELERINQQKEKKKQQCKARKKRRQCKLAEEMYAEAEKQKFLALSNREKIHFVETKRQDCRNFLLCFLCAKNINSGFPFSYSDYSFCSTQCLQKHRDN